MKIKFEFKKSNLNYETLFLNSFMNIMFILIKKYNNFLAFKESNHFFYQTFFMCLLKIFSIVNVIYYNFSVILNM